MGKYILKRLLLMFFVFFIIATMCFVLIHLLPGAPILRGIGVDPHLQEIRNEQMGYNDPILVQYFRYVANIVKYGYFGVGYKLYVGQNVLTKIMQKLPYSMIVNLYSILIAIPLGLGFGILAALKKNKWPDHVINVLVILFISVPSFVYAFLVQYLLCYKLGWFPLFSDSIADSPLLSPKMFWSMLPAIISLWLLPVASLTRYTRAELSEVLTSDFMLLARTKGLTKTQATVRHAMKNAMVVILPMIIGEFIGILGGSYIIESIFGIPGIGALYIQAINARDYNFFMAESMFYTLVGLLAGIVVDISYGFIDPRIRMGSRK